MYIIALFFAQNKETISNEEIEEIKAAMLQLPEKAEEVLKNKETVQKFTAKTYMHKDMFFIGSGLDYAVAMEGSLKLKEISYIHSDAYAAGELKHGPIALMEEGTIVIALATQEELFDKMVSNIKEVTQEEQKYLPSHQKVMTEIEKSVYSVTYIPKVMDILAPVISVIPLQLIVLLHGISKRLRC